MILVFKNVFSKYGQFRYLSIDNKTRLKSMRPTRWTVRCKAISAVLDNYLDIINALQHFTMESVNFSELIVKAYSNIFIQIIIFI